jgi:uncharacterized iron-regulated membrane protein
MGMSMRRVWIQIHLWLGLSLGVLGVAIGITGSVLVYESDFDALINPQRFAVSGREVGRPVGEYIDNAAKALGATARPALVRFGQEGAPVTVIARGREGAGFVRVYLDPPTARVLDVAMSGGFIGWVRQLHEYLLLREYSGREIVGVVGFGMLISSLSGLYLWWPARARFREALRFRRGLAISRNLHYVFGCYCALVLALLSFTGIFLAYPEGGRNAVAAVAAVSPSARNVTTAGDAAGRRITPDEAARIAREPYPDARITAIGLPTGPRGTYRVGMNAADDPAVQVGGNTVVFVDPVAGTTVRRIDASSRTSGDRFLALQRTLHSGLALGSVGRAVICFVGLLPGLFVVTGTTMWLRRRRVRRSARFASVSEAAA